MRRAEKDDLLELFPPRMALRLGDEAGAAGDEAAHAVADDDELLDFRRPGGDQRLQRLGEGAAVDRDVQAGIVGEIDRRIAEVAGERRAMIVVLARPLQVAHAEPVQEDGELARRLGERLGERLPVRASARALAAKAHGQRQRIAGLGQVVADDAVEHGERDLPPARDRLIVRVRADQRRNAAEPLTGQAERAAHPADRPAASHRRSAPAPAAPVPACRGWTCAYARQRR